MQRGSWKPSQRRGPGKLEGMLSDQHFQPLTVMEFFGFFPPQELETSSTALTHPWCMLEALVPALTVP